MWFKLLIIAFLFKASNQLPNPPDKDGSYEQFTPIPENAADDIENYFNILGPLREIKSIIQKSINRAVKKIENRFQSMRNNAGAVKNNATETVKREGRNFLGELEKIEKIAENYGVNITHCLANKTDIIKALQKQVTDDVQNCLNDKVDEAAGIVRKTVKDVKSYTKEYEHLELENMRCKRVVKCLLKVLFEISLKSYRVPKSIAQDVSDFTFQINNLIPDLPTCAKNVTGKVEAKGVEILANIKNCVDKIPQSTLLLI